MQPDKPKVTDLNPHLLCVLCGGYFIDATTVIECLHSFCRSCIVKYLERNKYCPICDVLIHKSKPLTNIRPDHTLQNIVYKLVPRLFQREMLMRRDFYRVNNMQYSLQDPMSMGIIPDDYHIFTPSDSVSICLHYESENCKKSIPVVHKRYLWCPASLPVVNLKKFVHIKFELASVDHFVELSHQNNLLDDHLTLMDVVYMFDWKRKDPLTISYRILKIEIDSVVSDIMDINEDKSLKSEDNVDESKVNVTNSVPNDNSNTNINIKETPVKLVENNTIVDNKASDSKEVQLEISENGIIKVTNISQTRDAIQPNVTIEQTDDAVKKEKILKIDDNDDDKKKQLKVYPGSKIKKNKPKLDTIVEKIKKQSSTKYKTLTSPTKHWNPSISKTSMLAKKKEVNGVDKKNQKFFKSREDDSKKGEDKTEESLKRLAEVPLMKINPQTLCPIMPSCPTKKSKKLTPKKNTLAQSLALLPVRPTNHNPFTSPLNPFMYGAFSNSGNNDSRDTNDFLKAMSELCPPSSTYHNSLPPSVSVLFNPLYAHHRQSQAKKTLTVTTLPADVQKLSANKQEEKNGEKDDPKGSEDKAKDECTNNNKGEDKMEVEKEIEKT